MIDLVPSGRLYLDGKNMVPSDSAAMRERIGMSQWGVVSVAVAIDDSGEVIDGPLITARGLSEADGSIAEESLIEIDEATEDAMRTLKRKKRLDDDEVERALVRAVKRSCEKTFGRKPFVDVSVLRV